jgi:hypothetical protein
MGMESWLASHLSMPVAVERCKLPLHPLPCRTVCGT